jgi:GT2 family glycosyltransferase/2-polyprenyl-3-methyl-5-hydroxy-6-metoxy-1,4-benzoquinol methylase/glycosyltransferase involved in cell wall biosynthesis
MATESRSTVDDSSAEADQRGRYDDQRAIEPTPDSSYGKLLAHVPPGARVLDVGCAYGGFSAALRRLRNCTVVGVEIDPIEAESARSRCDQLFVGDIADLVHRLPRDFDVVVAADVLEHLADPKTVLEALAGVLRPGGAVLASIPNVTHLSVILSLANGRFPRSREGLLDSTHVQFFGEQDVLELFRAAGYAASVVDRVRIDPRLTEFKSDLAAVPQEMLSFLERNPNADTYQFIVRAVPTAWATEAERQEGRPALSQTSGTIGSRLAGEVVDLHQRLARYHEELSKALEENGRLRSGMVDRSPAAETELRRLKEALARSEDARALAEITASARRSAASRSARADLAGLRVLYLADRDDAPFRYRCLNACEQLRESGVVANVAHVDDPTVLQRIPAYSVVVLFRLAWSDRVRQLATAARASGAAVAFDVDDLVFDPEIEPQVPFFPRLPPETQAVYRRQFAELRRTLEAADFCLGATPTIARRASASGKKAVVHPNLLSRAYVRLAAAIARARPALLRGPMIGYLSGSNTHDGDLAAIAEPLAQVLTERLDAKLAICGHARLPDPLRTFTDRILRIPYQDHLVYPWLIGRCSTVVAPIERISEFTDAKSALKVFEPGVFGVPVIASPTISYAAAIENGVSGFLAASDADWKDALLRLCQREASLAAGAAARRIALAEHGPDAYRGALARLLRPLAGRSSSPAESLHPLQPVAKRFTHIAHAAGTLARGVSLAAAPRRATLRRNVRHGDTPLDLAPLPDDAGRAVWRLIASGPGSGGILGSAKEPAGVVVVDRERPLASFATNGQAEPLPGASAGCRFRAFGPDPSFILRPWPAAAAGARWLLVEMSAVTDGAQAFAQLFWRPAKSAYFSEADSVRFPVNADGRTRIYLLDLEELGGFPARVSVVRFDPIDRIGQFEVVRVALLSAMSGADASDTRFAIAQRYLRGDGIEIGALQNPLRLPSAARVRYVDRATVPELRASYPELDGQPLVEPAILANAEDLASVPAESQDFVVANHVLEHMRNPLGALEQWLRVLKPGGTMYVAIPDRANPLDRHREVTAYRHLLEDLSGSGRKGTDEDRVAYFDCVRSAHPELPPAEQDALAEKYLQQDYSIHFHAFDRELFERVLQHACDGARANLVELVENLTEGYVEYIAVLRKPDRRARGVDVVVPVYNARELTRRCCESVLRHGTGDFRLVVVDDGSTEPGVREDLDAIAANDARVVLLRNGENQGFVKTANRGMRHAEGRDVLLLNSDTEVFAGYLDRLRDAAYTDDATGIVTPFSNNATIFSIPKFGDNPIPEGHTAESLAALVAASSRRLRPEMPTAVGFCMYIRSEVLQRVGIFDEQAFGRGFGEENDLCERAHAAGFKVRLCDDAFVWHQGKASFGEEGRILEERNSKVLREMHPRYEPTVARFCTTNPLAPLHREIEFHLPRLRTGARGAPLFLVHGSPFSESAGGTEHHVRDLARSLKLPRVVLGFPRGAELVAAEVLDGEVERATEFRFALARPPERFCIEHEEIERVMRRWLDLFGIAWAHVHHLMFWPISLGRVLRRAGVPYVMSAHDYYAICPSFNLFDYGKRARCDCPHQGDDCGPGCLPHLYAEAGFEPPGSFAELRRNHRAAFTEALQGARAIVTPSRAARDVLATHLGLGAGRVEVIGHAYESSPRAPRAAPGGRLRLAVLGEIAYPLKGADQYLELMARTRDLPVDWHVFGNVERFGYAEKLRLVGLGDRLHLRGEYGRSEIVRLLGENGIDLCVFLPLVDETFSFTLSEAFVAGVPALVLDRGALPERVTEEGAGLVVRSIAEAADQIARFCRARGVLDALTDELDSYRHRSAEENADHYRQLYARVGFPLAPEAELRPEWLHELSERAEIPAAPLYIPPPRTARDADSLEPVSRHARRVWYPLFRTVKPLVPLKVRQLGNKVLERIEAPPALILRIGRGTALHSLQMQRRTWRAAAFNALSDDPQIVFPVRPFAPEKVKQVRFRLRREKDGFALAQLFWTHDPGSGFSERMSAQIELDAKPGEWREYSLRLDAPEVCSQWQAGAQIVQLRFDPTTVPGQFELGPLEFLTW